MALIGAQIAMRIDQLFVEVVGRRKIGLCVQKFHGVASVAQPVARSKAARMLSGRSEEHTSELQSLMRISYAVFCLKKKKQQTATQHTTNQQMRNTAGTNT